MDNLPIIDPHHHLYDLSTTLSVAAGRRAQPIVFGDYSAIRENYLIDDFLADIENQNVVKSVHLHVEYDHNDPVAETRWLQSVADQHGFPHGIVAFADLSYADVQAVIEEHCAFQNIRGIRHTLNYHRDPVKTYHRSSASDERSAVAARLCACSRGFDFSFDLQIYYTQMEEASRLRAAFPTRR